MKCFHVKKVNKYRLALIGLAIICALLLILLLIFVLTHNDRTDTTSNHAPTWATPFTTPPAQPQAAEASAELAKLGTLPIKGRAPKTGYDRSLFGHAWTDDVTVIYGHNGCDTRNDILHRDLVDVEIKPGSNGCTVLAGVLHDPYSGTTVEFHRGRGTSSLVQIDHVVALSDAWQKGAQQWDPAKRRNFANDPINLQATTRSMNEQKRDGDAATWLPPNKSYRCTYVSRIVDVKAAYGLWVTQAEHDAIARILSKCGTPATRVITAVAVAKGQPVNGYREVPPGNANDVFDCDASPAAVDSDIYRCAPSAAGASVCWPSTSGTLLCGADPWDRELHRVSYTDPLPAVQPKTTPIPFALLLDDGTQCRMRNGGAWGGRGDGLEFAYGCSGGSAVLAPRDLDLAAIFDRSHPLWMVMVGPLSSGDLAPPQTHTVTTAWFAGN